MPSLESVYIQIACLAWRRLQKWNRWEFLNGERGLGGDLKLGTKIFCRCSREANAPGNCDCLIAVGNAGCANGREAQSPARESGCAPQTRRSPSCARSIRCRNGCEATDGLSNCSGLEEARPAKFANARAHSPDTRGRVRSPAEIGSKVDLALHFPIVAEGFLILRDLHLIVSRALLTLRSALVSLRQRSFMLRRA
jgi:hypothetical protein